MNSIQVKICGITTPEYAEICSRSGADSIGVVFFPKSPRNVSRDTAKDIAKAAIPETIITGVFVNESISFIMDKVKFCSLDAVQLHGNESPSFVRELKGELSPAGVKIIKCLYLESEPSVDIADNFDTDSFLIECSKGILPGGNAMDWNFSRAYNLNLKRPVILAGGLSPENINKALELAEPDAVDVSSGVEESPGKKSAEKVVSFINSVKNFKTNKIIRSVF